MGTVNVDATRRVLQDVFHKEMSFTEDEISSVPKEYLFSLLGITSKKFSLQFYEQFWPVLSAAWFEVGKSGNAPRLIKKMSVTKTNRLNNPNLEYDVARTPGLWTLQRFLQNNEQFETHKMLNTFKCSNLVEPSNWIAADAILSHLLFTAFSTHTGLASSDRLKNSFRAIRIALDYTLAMPADTDVDPAEKPTWAELSGIGNPAVMKKTWHQSMDLYVSFIQCSKEAGF